MGRRPARHPIGRSPLTGTGRRPHRARFPLPASRTALADAGVLETLGTTTRSAADEGAQHRLPECDPLQVS